MAFNSKSSFPSQQNPQDIELMPPGIAAYRRKPPRKISILMGAVVLFCFTFIIWANLAEIDEVARGEGKIIPSRSVQKVSNLEGGIIQQILVKEGDIVQKNQILMRIDPTIAEARLKEGRDNYYLYLAEVSRLKAQTEGKDFIVPKEVEQNAPHIAQETEKRYKARKERLSNEINIAQKELDQKNQELQELLGREVEAEKAVSISQQELAIQKPLVQRGLGAKMDLLKVERDLNDAQGRLYSTKVNIQKAKDAVNQATEKLKQISVVFQNEDYTELKEANNKLAQALGTFTSQGDITSRTEIRSPVKGIVKEVFLTTIGGVVKPGQDIMEIVPLDDSLLVEVNIKPSDIAFLHPGQPAMLKITAYDYSIYGGLHAELIDISPDTVVDEKDPRKSSYYRVKLRTTNLKFTKSKDEKPLIPGMIVTADIKTGKKTVMHYLLKPIIKAKDTALTER
jgi:adhesin transport system membrane fusion protein